MSEEQHHTYTVSGMTCGHCALSVEEEISELEGVSRVAVDLASGTVRVTGEVDAGAVGAAVREAGYEVVR